MTVTHRVVDDKIGAGKRVSEGTSPKGQDLG